jgi:RNA polymerase sigma-54 factor
MNLYQSMTNSQTLELRQLQKQVQKLSQVQITALNYLAMENETLRDEIYRAVSDNPALEIVNEPTVDFSRAVRGAAGDSFSRSGNSTDSDTYQRLLENQEDYGQTLQEHLLHQLNAMKISDEENQLCTRLIYNLDKNGFYGSMLSPETFLPHKNPAAERQLLERCLKIVQALDPVGTCCRTPEESLLIQAQLAENPNPLALFILDGHIDFLDPPNAAKICHKLIDYREAWQKKAFAGKSPLDTLELTEDTAAVALKFILSLNPHPAQGYNSEAGVDSGQPDVVLTVTKEEGSAADDYEHGIVSGKDDFHFQIKYASGALPEIRISPEFKIDKAAIAKAQLLINSLQFRESTIVMQGCAIVRAQKNFFLKGPGHLKVLTRRQIAKELGIHESTVSRTSAKKGRKYIQTEWGLFPVWYFFTSGVTNSDGSKKISSDRIKQKMQAILSEPGNENLSDRQLCQILNEKGAKIARRTVAKYRGQLGLNNSYKR